MIAIYLQIIIIVISIAKGITLKLTLILSADSRNEFSPH